MSNLFEHCRTGVSSASQRYDKPDAMQINLLFAEAKYSRCSQSAISLCQSAAGGGCAGRRRRSDAALCMGGCGLPLFGCGRRANLSKLYFSRPPACGIALQKQPNSHFGKHPAPPIGCLLQGADLPPFDPQKVAPKVSAGHLRRDRTEQCGICGALRATMIICWSPVLAGLRPAGSHCEKSGKIPTLHCIPSGTTNPVILRRKSKPIPTQTSTPASPRKQRRKRPCPIGFRHICPKTEK